MEPARHEFKIGKLVVIGDRFEFRPASPLKFEAHVDDAADLYLQYGYREASTEKETFTVRFTVALGGTKLGTKMARVDDTRVAKDEQWGLLKLETPLKHKGDLRGKYSIEATYEKGAWSGKGAVAKVPFAKSGEFTLTVRPREVRKNP